MIVNVGSQDVKLILNGAELTNPSGSPMVVTVKAADDGIKGFNDVAISGGSVTVSNSLEAIEAQTLVFSGARPG